MNGTEPSRVDASKLSSIGRTMYETSITKTNLNGILDSSQETAPGMKRERTNSLKQMNPMPTAQRPKGKGNKPTPIVTTNLNHTNDTTPTSARGGDKSNPRRWSKAEDESLRLAVERSGERNWKAIADQVVGRNHTQCLQRWTKVLKPGLIKGHWTPEEDAKLRALVAEGRKNWGQVASHIPGRTSKQCRERWCNHLDPHINKGNYTKEEDQLIIDMQAKLGNRWSVIAQQLSVRGRTEDAVKIRWKSLMRTKRTRDKTNDDGDESPSDDSASNQPPPSPRTISKSKPLKQPTPKVVKASQVKATQLHPPFLAQHSTSSISLRHPISASPPRPSYYIPNPTMVSRPAEASQSQEMNRQPRPYTAYPYNVVRHDSQPRHQAHSFHARPFVPPLSQPVNSSSTIFSTKPYPRMPPPPASSYPFNLPPPPYDQSGMYMSSNHPNYHRLNTPRDEWGTSHTPQSHLLSNVGRVSDYELLHQQRLRLMVQERERAGPTLSPAASPGQALLTKELEANSERQKRQAIMQNGWKNAAVATQAELSKAPSEYEEQRFDGFLENEIDPTDDTDYRSRVTLPPVE